MLELARGTSAFMMEPQTRNPLFTGEHRLGESADGVGGI
jgi:hypothetical protein